MNDIEWTEEAVQQFYTALEVLDEVMTKKGVDPEALISKYFEQKRSGLIEPERVINRIAVATERWSKA